LAKIIALYINELIKISKKISVYIVLLIMLASMFVTGGILKFAQDRQESRMTNPNIGQFMNTDMQDRLTATKTKLDQTNTQIATAPPAQKKQLEAEAAGYQYQIDSINTAINKNIYLYTNYYLAQAIQALEQYKNEAYTLDNLPAGTLTQAQKDEQALLASLIPRMQKAIDNKDFKEYTAIINQKISADPNMSQTDKDIQLGQNNLRLKYNVTNEDQKNIFGRRFDITSSADDIINNIATAKKSLAYNLDFAADPNSPVPLTNDRRAQISDNITVYMKQLEIGSINNMNFTALGRIFDIGIFMISVLLLILAGGAISQEIATGSIKSLVISPTKRWKIYVAKLLSLITVVIGAAIICYIFGIIAFKVFFGANAVSPYIYVSSGKAALMNFYSFNLAKLFIGLIEVVFYTVLAMMLSTLTRNTAASVGISIGVLFGGKIAFPILTNILTGEWLKFLPFPNLDFASKIFTFDPSLSAASGVSTSLTFAAIYMIAAVSLLFYIGLDSFCRRDIR
jgi:ABC-type transport system involved in multi-copper enzyme maturation permease subunit